MDECRFSNIWIAKCFGNDKWLTNVLQLRLQDQFKQYWNTQLQESTNAVNYRTIKLELHFEMYFEILEDRESITNLFNVNIEP